MPSGTHNSKVGDQLIARIRRAITIAALLAPHKCSDAAQVWRRRFSRAAIHGQILFPRWTGR